MAYQLLDIFIIDGGLVVNVYNQTGDRALTSFFSFDNGFEYAFQRAVNFAFVEVSNGR